MGVIYESRGHQRVHRMEAFLARVPASVAVGGQLSDEEWLY